MPKRVYKAVPLNEDPGWVKVGGFYTEPQTLSRARQPDGWNDTLVFWKYATQENSVYGGTIQLFEEYRGRPDTWSDGVTLVNAVGELAYIDEADIAREYAAALKAQAKEDLYRSVWPDLSFGPLPGEDDGLR
jgi:hypothetical protein